MTEIIDIYRIMMDVSNALEGGGKLNRVLSEIRDRYAGIAQVTGQYDQASNKVVAGTIKITQGFKTATVAAKQLEDGSISVTKTLTTNSEAATKAVVDGVIKRAQAIKRLNDQIAKDQAAAERKQADQEQKAIERSLATQIKARQAKAAAEEAANRKQLEAFQRQQAAIDRIESRRQIRAGGQYVQAGVEQTIGNQLFARQRNVLSGIQVSVTDKELSNNIKAINSVSTLVAKNKELQASFPTIAANVFAGRVDNLTGSAAKLQNALLKVIQTEKAFGDAAYKAAQQQDKLAQSTEKTGKSFLIGAQGLAKYAQYYTLFLTTSTALNTLRQGVTSAIDFSNAVARIQTLAQDLPATFNDWSDAALKFSSATGISAADAAKAFYSTLSQTQGKSKAEIEAFSRVAVELSTVLGTDINSSATLLTSTINSLGLSMNDARRLAALYFNTVDVGNVSIQQLDSTFGRTLVVAKQLGVSFEEATAAIATLTRQGIEANTANTQLYNIFNQLLKPSEQLKQLYKEWGVETGDAAIKTFGFAEILKRLDIELQKGSSRIAELIPEIRGMQGTFGLTGEGIKQFIDILDSHNSALERTNKAVNLVFDNYGKRIEIAKTQLDNLGTKVGGGIIVGLTKLTDTIGLTSAEYSTKLAANIANAAKATGDLTKNVSGGLASVNELIDKSNRDLLQAAANARAAISSNVKGLDDIIKSQIANIDKVKNAAISAIENKAKAARDLVKDFQKTIDALNQGNLDRAAKRTSDARDKAFSKLAGDPRKEFEFLETELTKAIAKLQAVPVGDAEKVKAAQDDAFKAFDAYENKFNEIKAKRDELNKQSYSDLSESDKRLSRQLSDVVRFTDIEDVNKRLTVAVDSIISKVQNLRDTNESAAKSLEAQALQTKTNIQAAADGLERLAKVDLNNVKNAADHAAKLAEAAKIFTSAISESGGNFKFEIPAEVFRIFDTISDLQRNAAAERNKQDVNAKVLAVTNELKKLEPERKRIADEISKIQAESQALIGTVQSGLSINKFNIPLKDLSAVKELEERINIFLSKELDTTKITLDSPSVIAVLEDIQKLLVISRGIPTAAGSVAINDAAGNLGSALVDIAVTNSRLKELDGTQASLISRTSDLAFQQAQLAAELQSLVPSIPALTGAVNDLTKTIQQIPAQSPPPQQRASGGLGPDTVSALLSPGEYIMNRKSTAQFYSKLVGMNSANRGFASGGNITNVTTGDFKISATTTGNTSTDVIALGKALRREIQRGTVSLF